MDCWCSDSMITATNWVAFYPSCDASSRCSRQSRNILDCVDTVSQIWHIHICLPSTVSYLKYSIIIDLVPALQMKLSLNLVRRISLQQPSTSNTKIAEFLKVSTILGVVLDFWRFSFSLEKGKRQRKIQNNFEQGDSS